MADVPVQIVLRPYASALPLAVFAFATGNVLYSSLLLGWIPAAEAHTVGLMLLAFVGPLELGPSAMAFVTRDTGGATAFGIFGASWLVDGLALLHGPPEHLNPAAAIFSVCLTVCLLLIAVVTVKGKPLLGAVLSVAALRTIGLAWLGWTGTATAARLTGWCGVLVGLMAFYAAAVFFEEDVTQRISPLTLRTGEARRAMEGKLSDQIASIEREAGVRKQL